MLNERGWYCFSWRNSVYRPIIKCDESEMAAVGGVEMFNTLISTADEHWAWIGRDANENLALPRIYFAVKRLLPFHLDNLFHSFHAIFHIPCSENANTRSAPDSDARLCCFQLPMRENGIDENNEKSPIANTCTYVYNPVVIRYVFQS